MNRPEQNQTPLNAPASGATPAAPSNQAAAPKTSGKQPADETEAQTPSQDLAQKPTQGDAQVPAPAATPPVKQDVDSLKQAAQLEHKPSSDGVPNPGGSNDCAPAGGPGPQSPEPIAEAKSAKKDRKQKLDNHVSVRFPDTELEIIEERMERTGERQSEAVRGIVRDHLNKEGDVYLAPKTPPEQLENFLGELSKWRGDFKKAQPRLNMPTPKNDDPRHKQVTEWRAESKRLLDEIKKVESVLRAALGSVSSLTPRKVGLLKQHIPFFQRCLAQSSAKGDKMSVELWEALLQLIDDMGIKPKP